jgi:hypothetical protein
VEPLVEKFTAMARRLTTILFLALAFVAYPCCVESSDGRWQRDLAFLAHALTKYHVNAFHKISKTAFQIRVQALRAHLPRMDDAAAIVALKQLVASIGDAHTGFGFSSEPPMNFFIFPIKVYRYPDGIYVQAATPGYRELIGARIISIGGLSMAEVERRLDTVADASNAWTQRWWLPFTFRGQVFKALGLSRSAFRARFAFERAGRTEVVDLPVIQKPLSVGYSLGAPLHSGWTDRQNGHPPLYLQHLERPLWFSPMGKGALYVRCSIVGDSEDESFGAFFARVFTYVDQAAIDKLILDLRMNGGGDNTLTPAVVQSVVKRPKINHRGHFFVIIGRSTQSAAENLVDRLQRDTEAVFVGEPTGERPNMFGDPQSFVLPESRIAVNISSLYWQDMGPRDNRDTTGPEIAAELTEHDFEAGLDPAMEAIAHPLEPSFGEVMESALGRGTDEAHSAYVSYVRDPIHRFVQIESATEALIDDLIDKKRYELAEVLCDLNLSRYRTASAYDELGSLQEARKNVSRAKLAYESALKIDPRDAVAASRLSVLGGNT